MSKYLDAPDYIEEKNDVDEALRVWIGTDDSIVTLRDIFGDNINNWGMIMADVAVHVARMKKQSASIAMEETLKQIESGYRGRMAEFHNLDYQTLSEKN